MGFTPDGVFVQGWGGDGEGYEWPADEHGIHVDYMGNVWISSAGGPRMGSRTENHLLKRMWGAYGTAPDDDAENGPAYEGAGAAQFNTVHGIRVSHDGRVYVADRRNNRIQVFTLDGDFEQEVFIERATRLLGTAFSVAFSPDPEQRHLYVADAGNGRIHILDRESLEILSHFGRIGRYAGEFVFLHNVAVDSRGNVYTSEVGGGRRVQKFLLD